MDDMIRSAVEAGRTIDEEVIQRAELLDQKFDQLGRSARAFFQSLAVGAAEATGIIATAEAHLDRAFGGEARARSILGDDLYEELRRNLGVIDDNARLLATLSVQAGAVADEARRMANELDLAAEGLREIGQTDAARAVAQAASDMRDLTQEWRAGQIEPQEYAKRLSEVHARAEGAFGAVEGISDIRFAAAISDLGIMGDMLGRILGIVRHLKMEMAPDDTIVGDPEVSPLAPATSPRARQQSVDSFGNWQHANRPSGGGRGRDSDDYARMAQAIRDRTAALEAEAVALIAAAAGGEDYGRAVEFARVKAGLLTAAQKAGKEITPELRAEIDALAESYANAGQEAGEAAGALRRVQDAAERGAEAITDVFMAVLDGSRSAKDAIADLLMQMARVQMKKAILGLDGAGGFLGFLGFLGKALSEGFAGGGYTGAGGRLEPAGIVHRGEYVFSKAATERIGVGALETMHRGALKGYAAGGHVAPARAMPGAPAFGSVGGEARLRILLPEQFEGELEGMMTGIAVEVSKQGLASYDKTFNSRARGAVNDRRRR